MKLEAAYKMNHVLSSTPSDVGGTITIDITRTEHEDLRSRRLDLKTDWAAQTVDYWTRPIEIDARAFVAIGTK